MTTATRTEASEKTGATREAAWLERFEQRPGEPEAIVALRRSAIERFERTGFPTLQDEEWRQTNVAPVSKTLWTPSTPGELPTAADVAPLLYEGCRHFVFVDGHFAAELSDEPPAGVRFDSLAVLLENGSGDVLINIRLPALPA